MLFKLFEMLLCSGRISGLIVAGGCGVSSYGSSRVDFLVGDQGMKQLPNLPQNINGSSMVAHDGTILLCGGKNNVKKCLQLDRGMYLEGS